MKKILLMLCIITGFISCKQPANPPTAVLDGMFTAMKSGNIEEMKKYVSKTDLAMLEAAEKIMTSVDPEGLKKIKARMIEGFKENTKDITYSFKNEKIEGDHATVETEIVNNKPDSLGVKKTGTHTFELVKEGNAWKIALSKPGNEMFNSMKGNMGAQKGGGLNEGLEKLQKMDPDSLKMLINKGLQAMDSMDKKKKDR
jgi:hypothetical protein